MAQNLKSSDEPRIVDDPENLFWHQYKALILGGVLVIVIGLAVGAFLWSKQSTQNAEALALYAKARSPEAWQEVATNYPKSPSAALALIQLASRAKATQDYPAMLGFYTTFLKDFPKHPAAPAVKFAQAQLLQATGKTAEAKSAYEEILDAKPEHPFFGGASVALARLYQSEKDNSRARQILEVFTAKAQSSAYAQEANTLLAGLSTP